MDVAVRSRVFALLQTVETLPQSAQLTLSATALILDWNAAAENLLHLTPEHALGYSLFDVFAADDPFRRVELLRAFKHAVEYAPHGVCLKWRGPSKPHPNLLRLEFHPFTARDDRVLQVLLLLIPEESIEPATVTA